MSISIESENRIVSDAVTAEMAFNLVIANDEEVAYSAEGIRSMAAAKRLVDDIAAEAKVNGTIDLEMQSVSGRRLLAAYAIYTGAFIELFHPSQPDQGMDYQEFPRAVSKILQGGGLPLCNIFGNEPKNGAELLDKKAETIETATEALLTHPPSQNFLTDNGLGRKHYVGRSTKEPELRITVENVTDLLSTVEYLDQQIVEVKGKYDKRIEYFKNLDDDAVDKGTKYDALKTMLQEVTSYVPPEYKDYRRELKNDIRVSENSLNTRLRDLYDLYLKGASNALELIKELRDKKQATYDAIISGEAASYKSPEPDVVEAVK